VESSTSSAFELLKEVGRVFLTSLIIWTLLAGPAWFAASLRGLTGVSFATLLCLLPGVVVVVVKALLQLSEVSCFLLASGLRISFVIGGALFAKSTVDDITFLEFPLWLLLNYMFVLAVESVTTLKRMGQTGWGGETKKAQSDKH
jgi:hypothetical protein